MDQGNRNVIEVVAAIVEDESGRVLLVRKKGTLCFMQPGGKRQPNETDLEALHREILEELGCGLVGESAEALGTKEAPAANEPGERVRAALYRVRLTGQITPAAEIEETMWVFPRASGNLVLAPITRDYVFPLVRGSTDPITE